MLRRPATLVLFAAAGFVAACANGNRAANEPAPALSGSPPVPGLDVDAAPELPLDGGGADGGDATVATAAPDPEPEKPMLSTRELVSFVFETTSIRSAHVGILRAGGKVVRSAEPVDAPPCAGPDSHWYSIEPRGYVCEGYEGVTTDMSDPAVVAAAEFPARREEPFPYGYATSWGSPLYARVPTAAQAKALEGDIEGRIASRAALRAKMSERKRWPETALPVGAMPAFLEGHALSPNLVGMKIGANALTAGNAWPDMRLSLVDAFDVDGRIFYLTSEHFLVPNDRVRPAKLCDFHGVELAAPDDASGEHLPFIWVNWKPVTIFRLDGTTLRPTQAQLAVQAHAQVAKDDFFVGPQRYYELLAVPDGVDLEPGQRYFVPQGPATRVDAATELPPGVPEGEEWIDIAIGTQTLVVYHGLVPKFATLVSTGVDGAGDITKTKSTPRGTFRIVSKHTTARMAADERPPQTDDAKPDPRYRIDDVPHVQYFIGSYAIHGAYWHDAFGQPKSHGCVNVSPRDALYLFDHTSPAVPDGWHSAWANKAGAEQGTWVHVRNF